jgi:uncharacterized protein YceH (UPF0502 family)
MDGLQLSQVEARVLGALIEKEITTPNYYPLSLNALTNACNQINSRDPVVIYGEAEVLHAVESLRDKRLAYVSSGAVSRVLKYGHKAAEVLALPRPDLAVMCVLLLRGPQTVGDIRGRTGRMHEFNELAEVQAVLQALSARPVPLVACLPRQAGTKEPRYSHLLGDEAAAPRVPVGIAEGPPPPAGRDNIARLEAEVEGLRRDMDDLRRQLADFRRQFE